MMSRLAKFTALATLVALVTLVPLASQAFEIVAPSKEWWWVANASNHLYWKANHSDPEHFTVQLVNAADNSQMKPNFEIGNDIQTAKGQTNIRLDSVPEGTYKVLFVSPNSEQKQQPDIYYQSEPFDVKHNGLAQHAVNPNLSHDPYADDNGGGSASKLSNNGDQSASGQDSSPDGQKGKSDQQNKGKDGKDGGDDDGLYNQNGQTAAKPAVTPDEANGNGEDKGDDGKGSDQGSSSPDDKGGKGDEPSSSKDKDGNGQTSSSKGQSSDASSSSTNPDTSVSSASNSSTVGTHMGSMPQSPAAANLTGTDAGSNSSSESMPLSPNIGQSQSAAGDTVKPANAAMALRADVPRLLLGTTAAVALTGGIFAFAV